MEKFNLENSSDLSKITKSWDKNQDLFSTIAFFATISFCLFPLQRWTDLIWGAGGIVSYSNLSLVNKMDDQPSVMGQTFTGSRLYTRHPDKCCTGHKKFQGTRCDLTLTLIDGSKKLSCDYSIIESSFLELLILYYLSSINRFRFIKSTEKTSTLVNT